MSDRDRRSNTVADLAHVDVLFIKVLPTSF